MSKPRSEGPSPPFSIAPKSFPEGLLGHPSLEESYLSLANSHSLGAMQAEVKWAEAAPLLGR